MPKTKPYRSQTSVCIIGAGRLGQALALALNKSNFAVIALVARRAGKAEKAGRIVRAIHPRVQIFGAHQLGELPPASLSLITTPDDVIKETAIKLAALEGARVRGRTVLHTSGALSSAVLAPLAELGFHTGSLHPLVSVSDPVTGAKALEGAFFCVEGDATATRMARRIVSDLQGHSFSIAPESKALYHAAALTAAGHLTALVDLAIEMLVACGVTRKNAQIVLVPLVKSAVNNLEVSSPEKALTGTFARGDLATVRRHLEALSSKELEEALTIYKILGLRSLRLAARKGTDSKVLDSIEKLLRS